jgi:hypothetical protein
MPSGPAGAVCGVMGRFVPAPARPAHQRLPGGQRRGDVEGVGQRPSRWARGGAGPAGALDMVKLASVGLGCCQAIYTGKAVEAGLFACLYHPYPPKGFAKQPAPLALFQAWGAPRDIPGFVGFRGGEPRFIAMFLWCRARRLPESAPRCTLPNGARK